MSDCEETANVKLEGLTEQVLDSHDGPLGWAETDFFNVGGINLDNEVIETAWLA